LSYPAKKQTDRQTDKQAAVKTVPRLKQQVIKLDSGGDRNLCLEGPKIQGGLVDRGTRHRSYKVSGSAPFPQVPGACRRP